MSGEGKQKEKTGKKRSPSSSPSSQEREHKKQRAGDIQHAPNPEGTVAISILESDISFIFV